MTEKLANGLPSQFPALRLTLERQMERYQERLTRQIRKEAAKRGENVLELANALGVYPTTVERWLRGDRSPQRRHRTQLAKHWELPLDFFEFDPEEEGDQLDRIEGKLDQLLEAMGLPTESAEDGDGEPAPADLIPEADRPHAGDAAEQA